jgi:hypothetical protein
MILGAFRAIDVMRAKKSTPKLPLNSSENLRMSNVSKTRPFRNMGRKCDQISCALHARLCAQPHGA